MPLADKPKQDSSLNQMPFLQNCLPEAICRTPCRSGSQEHLPCWHFSVWGLNTSLQRSFCGGRGGLKITPQGLAVLLPALTCGQAGGQSLGTLFQLPAGPGPLGTWGIPWHWQPGPGCAFTLSLLSGHNLKSGGPRVAVLSGSYLPAAPSASSLYPCHKRPVHELLHHGST